MQQRASAFGRLVPKLWLGFHVASALSLVLCVGAYTAQVNGWGVRLFSFTVGSYARPPEYLYGLTWGEHYATFAGIWLVTVWLPVLWILAASCWMVLKLHRRRNRAA
ncbi:MAG TPA: hypothetical protein VF669_09350 [Tepidisphaeraceae bacterium]|jgi:hypothetical protein